MHRPLLSAPNAFAIGAATSGVAVAGFTTDWACSAIGAAILGGFGCLALHAIASRSKRPSIRPVLVASLLLAIAQAVHVQSTLRRDAIRSVFGTLATDAIPRDCDVRRFYAGGPGDRVTLLHFRGDPLEIGALVAAMPPTTGDALDAHRAGDLTWPQFFASVMSPVPARHPPDWTDVPPMREPHLYESTSSPAGRATERRSILWDAATGDAFVVFSEG